MDIKDLLTPKPPGESVSTETAFPPFRAGDRLTATVLAAGRGQDALLAFGRFNAYARLPLPVSAGQEIQVRAEPAIDGLRLVMEPTGTPGKGLSTGTPLIIDPFEPVSSRPPAPAQLRSLIPGTLIEGRITGIEKDGQMLVDFGRFKAFARIDIPVNQGQTLALQVVDNGQPLALRAVVVRESGAGVKLPAHALPPLPPSGTAPVAPSTYPAPAGNASPPPMAMEMATFREALRSLRQAPAVSSGIDTGQPPSVVQSALSSIDRLLSPITLSDPLSDIIQKVRQFVETSGIYFEKNLERILSELQQQFPSVSPEDLYQHPSVRHLLASDMKPNLLILQQFLDRSPATLTEPDSPAMDRPTLELLKSVVHRTLSHIEQQQITATEKPVDQALFQAFTHLLHLTDAKQNTRLRVYYSRKGKPGEKSKPPRVSLLLEMDRIGTLRSDLWMVGRDLNITFFVRDAAVKADIESTTHQIRDHLKDIFSTVAVSVVISEKKIAEFDGEALTSRRERLVDISI